MTCSNLLLYNTFQMVTIIIAQMPDVLMPDIAFPNSEFIVVCNISKNTIFIL